MYKPFHFYLVFNPMLNAENLYPTQAHEFYHTLKNNAVENNGCLYWGKLSVAQSPETQQRFQELIDLNQEHGHATHLYLTDYHHFWVAKVERVQKELHSEKLTLPFYQNKSVEMWFKITDMDLLSAEFQESNHYISQLTLDHEYSEQKIFSLNPYIGGLQFPLVVQDNQNESYFNSNQSRMNQPNILIESPMKYQRAKEEVISFVLPPHVYKKLSASTKNEILISESLLSACSFENEARKKVYLSYGKVLNNVMNQVVGQILKSLYGQSLFVSLDGQHFFEEALREDVVSIENMPHPVSLQGYVNLLQDLCEFGNLSLSQIEKDYPELTQFYLNTLIPYINQAEVISKFEALDKNQSVEITAQEVFALRNFVLGVGCEGVINYLFNHLWSRWEKRNLDAA